MKGWLKPTCGKGCRGAGGAGEQVVQVQQGEQVQFFFCL
tara:strand:- start:2603 stop:2719 length:117 start_codon:yes stop_codon:yes gene_type:complete